MVCTRRRCATTRPTPWYRATATPARTRDRGARHERPTHGVGRRRRDDEPRQREQPGEVQERRRDRASWWFGVQPVRQRPATPARARARPHAVPADNARHAGLALQRCRRWCTPSADSRHTRDGGRTTLNQWATSIRAAASLHQTDDYKAALSSRSARAMSSRGATSRTCQPLLASSSDGYWSAGALDGNRRFDRQVAGADAHLEPCAVFPHSNTRAGPARRLRLGAVAAVMPAASAAARSSSAASISTR